MFTQTPQIVRNPSKTPRVFSKNCTTVGSAVRCLSRVVPKRTARFYLLPIITGVFALFQNTKSPCRSKRTTILFIVFQRFFIIIISNYFFLTNGYCISSLSNCAYAFTFRNVFPIISRSRYARMASISKSA